VRFLAAQCPEAVFQEVFEHKEGILCIRRRKGGMVTVSGQRSPVSCQRLAVGGVRPVPSSVARGIGGHIDYCLIGISDDGFQISD